MIIKQRTKTSNIHQTPEKRENEETGFRNNMTVKFGLCDFMIVWFYVCVILWLYDFMFVWFYDWMILWLCDFMIVWLYDFMIVWFYDCVIVWLYELFLDHFDSRPVVSVRRVSSEEHI